MNRIIKSIILPMALLASVLAGCGGGSSGGTDDSGSTGGSGGSDAAKLATTDEVVFFFAAMRLGFSAEEPSDDGYSYSSASQATTKDCGIGSSSGSMTFIPDDSTIYTFDGTYTINQCQSNKYEGESFTNGQRIDKCVDSAQTADTCKVITSKFADGPDGSTTFDFGVKDSSSSSPIDTEWKLKGDYLLSDFTSSGTGGSYGAKETGTIVYTDNLKKFSANLKFVDMETSGVSNADGSGTVSVKGTYSVNSNQAHCPSGTVTVKTSAPVSTNSAEAITGGQLDFTSSNNKVARINFNSDDTFIVTLADGKTKTYSQSTLRDDIQSLCN